MRDHKKHKLTSGNGEHKGPRCHHVKGADLEFGESAWRELMRSIQSGSVAGHHVELLRMLDYRRRWIRITWPDGRTLDRLRRSTTTGIVVLARVGGRVVALQGDAGVKAWSARSEASLPTAGSDPTRPPDPSDGSFM